MGCVQDARDHRSADDGRARERVAGCASRFATWVTDECSEAGDEQRVYVSAHIVVMRNSLTHAQDCLVYHHGRCRGAVLHPHRDGREWILDSYIREHISSYPRYSALGAIPNAIAYSMVKIPVLSAQVQAARSRALSSTRSPSSSSAHRHARVKRARTRRRTRIYMRWVSGAEAPRSGCRARPRARGGMASGTWLSGT